MMPVQGDGEVEEHEGEMFSTVKVSVDLQCESPPHKFAPSPPPIPPPLHNPFLCGDLSYFRQADNTASTCSHYVDSVLVEADTGLPTSMPNKPLTAPFNRPQQQWQYNYSLCCVLQQLLKQ